MRAADFELSPNLFDLSAWRHFAPHLRGRRHRLLLLGCVAAAQSLLVLPVLHLIRYAFDVAIPESNLSLLLAIGAAIFGIRVVEGGLSLALRAANLKVIKRAVADLRSDLVKRLYEFSRDFHARSDRDEIHVRVVQDTERVDNMCNALVSRIVPSLLTGTAIFVVLCFLNWQLVGLMATLVPVFFFALRRTGRFVKRWVFVFQRAFEGFSKGIAFVLQNMDLTRIQAYEAQEVARQEAHIDALRETGERMVLGFAFQGEVQRTVTWLAAIAIMVGGGAAVTLGVMTLGGFMAFFVAAGQLNRHLNAVIGALPDIITGNESMVTLLALMQSGESRPYEGDRCIEFSGRIELRGAEFRYGDEPVLRQVDLCVEPGARIAIVGPNGSGKTTILNLVLGFYRPSSGEVLADGVPYEELDVLHLRRAIGVVNQHPDLFVGSIRDNLTYGWPDADEAEVRRASELALAHEFIRELPQGYDTAVGQGGMLLSGGECQRIAIARALLGEPRLLILDEPTNHLDRKTVGRLMESLRGMPDSPAILLVSHDPHVVSYADEVYEIERGLLRALSAKEA